MYTELNEASLSIKARIAIKKYCETTPKSERSWDDFSSKNPGFTEEDYKCGLSLFGEVKPTTNAVTPAIKPVNKPEPKPAQKMKPLDSPLIAGNKPSPLDNATSKEDRAKAMKDFSNNVTTVDGIQMSLEKTFRLTESYVLKRYKEFNKKYFDNTLPIIPVRLSKAKNNAGCYSYKSNRYNPDAGVFDEKLSISTFMQRSEVVFCNTLLHEMIHVYQIHVLKCRVSNMRSWAYAHGSTFCKKMEELNKLGWKIAVRVTEEEHNEAVASPEQVSKLKRSGRIMVYVNDRLLACIPKNKIDEYKSRYRGCTLKFFNILDYAEFVQYPMCQSRLCGHGMTPAKLQGLVDANKLSLIENLSESLHNSNEIIDKFDVPEDAGAVLVDTNGEEDLWVIA